MEPQQPAEALAGFGPVAASCQEVRPILSPDVHRPWVDNVGQDGILEDTRGLGDANPVSFPS